MGTTFGLGIVGVGIVGVGTAFGLGAGGGGGLADEHAVFKAFKATWQL